MPSITHARLLVRASAAGVAAFALTGAVAIVPPAASALTTQPVTVVTSVDGVPVVPRGRARSRPRRSP